MPLNLGQIFMDTLYNAITYGNIALFKIFLKISNKHLINTNLYCVEGHSMKIVIRLSGKNAFCFNVLCQVQTWINVTYSILH